MRSLLFVTTALVAVCAAMPAFAGGFYAGLYGGASIRDYADFEFGWAGAEFADIDNSAPVDSIANPDGVEPAALHLLNTMLDLFPDADEAEALAISATGFSAWDVGPTFGAVAGYKFDNGLRVEGEFSSHSYNLLAVDVSDAIREEIDGELNGSGDWTWEVLDEDPGTIMPPAGYVSARNSLQFLLANVWYDFGALGPVTPYVGGGVGMAKISTVWSDFTGDLTSSETWSPAAAVGAGITTHLGNNVSLDVGYRYRAAFDTRTFAENYYRAGNYAFGISAEETGTIGVHAIQAGLMFALP